MSRPSSRVTRDEGYGSRIQQQQQQGPSRGDGSSNGRAAGPPFTPGPASASVTGSYRAYAAAGAAGPPPPRTSASTSTRSLGLSAKEVDRLSETIASVQRGSSRLSMHGSGNGSGSANDDMRPSASAPVLGLRNGKAQSNGGERERVRSSRDHAGKGKGRGERVPMCDDSALMKHADRLRSLRHPRSLVHRRSLVHGRTAELARGNDNNGPDDTVRWSCFITSQGTTTAYRSRKGATDKHAPAPDHSWLVASGEWQRPAGGR